jgi:two-component system, OmpR family, alkaline phosphatase synthesis response regulator PhoP
MPLKILIADDEPDIIEFLQYNLEKQGYEVTATYNGEQACIYAEQQAFDLIILDVMMPEMSGIQACNAIRKGKINATTLIAFLTAMSEDIAQIQGFEAGADDYIPKPIRPQLLVSRIQALLRRVNIVEKNAADNVLAFENLTINRENVSVIWNEIPIPFAKKEFEIFWLLAEKPSRVFTREEIFAKIWGSDVIVGDRTIDVHIRGIRKKLDDNFIKTVKGVGYKFEV